MSDVLSAFLSSHGIETQVKHADDGPDSYTTAVIVAVPSELDPVRLVGDEDKHATILFFGETATLPDEAKGKIIQVLASAANMFEPFRDSISEVVRLGSENPPALVGKLNGLSLTQIRDVLQIVPDLNEYMGNASQYPSYTPHVTFGYPDYAGEAEIRAKASSISIVKFDRLALWWNGEKYEFPLSPYKNDGSESVMHSAVANFMSEYGVELKHYGVKGMRWGVRRDSSGGGVVSRLRSAKANSAEKKAMNESPPGTIRTATRKSDGKKVLIQKKSNGQWEETYLSKDAENFAKLHMKSQHQLSNAEMRSYLERARLMKDYNDLFAPRPGQNTSPQQQGKGDKKPSQVPSDDLQKLRERSERLGYQVKIAEAQARLRPPSTISRVSKFVEAANPAFKVFKELDKLTGNAMSEELKFRFNYNYSQDASKRGQASTSNKAYAKQQKRATKRAKASMGKSKVPLQITSPPVVPGEVVN